MPKDIVQGTQTLLNQGKAAGQTIQAGFKKVKDFVK